MAGLHNHKNEIRSEIADKSKGVSSSVAVAAGANPTKAEFDALVAEFNKLVQQLQAK